MEAIDLDTYISDMQQMQKAMSVLYRPITQKFQDKYKIQEYLGDTLHDTMLDTPMSAVVSSILFLRFREDLSIAMMNLYQERKFNNCQQDWT